MEQEDAVTWRLYLKPWCYVAAAAFECFAAAVNASIGRWLWCVVLLTCMAIFAYRATESFRAAAILAALRRRA